VPEVRDKVVSNPLTVFILSDRTREAQAAIDARNLRFKRRSTTAARVAQKYKNDGIEIETRELSDRLEAAEKALENFVANRIQPAVQKVDPPLPPTTHIHTCSFSHTQYGSIRSLSL
jgi:hypothetical protein